MALTVGSPAADAGMSKAIFTQLDALLSPPLQAAVDSASDEAKPAARAALDASRTGWRNLAYAIAKGVIDHVVANLEISGVTVSGSVSVPVSGSTAVTSGHSHAVSITPTITPGLAQNNNGPGRVS